MKNLIIYASKYGTAEKCAGLLQGKLHGETLMVNSREKSKIRQLDLNAFDKIIIGGSIHAGRVQQRLVKFCKNHQALLRKKEVGLFLCTLTPPEEALHYYEKNFPAELVQRAKAVGCFGGELYFAKMNFLEKFIFAKAMKITEDISRLDNRQIDKFAEQMNSSAPA